MSPCFIIMVQRIPAREAGRQTNCRSSPFPPLLQTQPLNLIPSSVAEHLLQPPLWPYPSSSASLGSSPPNLQTPLTPLSQPSTPPGIPWEHTGYCSQRGRKPPATLHLPLLSSKSTTKIGTNHLTRPPPPPFCTHFKPFMKILFLQSFSTFILLFQLNLHDKQASSTSGRLQ